MIIIVTLLVAFVLFGLMRCASDYFYREENLRKVYGPWMSLHKCSSCHWGYKEYTESTKCCSVPTLSFLAHARWVERHCAINPFFSLKCEWKSDLE